MFKPRDPAPEEKPPEVDFMRLMLGLRTELAHSVGGVLLRGSRAVPVGVVPGATASVLTSPGRLVGWSLTEASGAADALVRLYDGDPAAGGTLIARLPLVNGQNDTKSVSPGVGVVRGIYALITAGDGSPGGTVEGSVWVGEVD